jgi:hypothetical protein
MQPAISKLDKGNPSSLNMLSQGRKAALGAAFRWLPVALAFVFSTFCVLFLLNVHPTSAFNGDTENLSGNSTQLDYMHAPSFQKQKTHSELSSIFTKEVFFWEEEIIQWAETYHLDPNLVAVVMQIESCGHPDIESRSGAKGLFQVMSFHFANGENPFSPDINAQRGLSYLSKGLSLALDDPALALAGYNGGHSVIGWDPSQWPDETKRYVYWGSGILADIARGSSQSSRLAEWLEAGGKSLCRNSSEALGF